MSLRLLRFLNCSDWAGKFLKEGCGLFVFCQLTQFRVTEEVTAKLIKSAYHQIERDGILATRLCTHKDDVDLTNENKLQQLPGLNSSDCPAHKKKEIHVLLCLAWIQLKMDNTYGNLVIIHFLSRVWSILPGNLRNVLFIYFPNCFINWHRRFWSSEQKTITLWKAPKLWLFFLLFLYMQVVFTCLCLPKCPVSPKINPKQVLSVSTGCWFCHFL